MCQKTKLLKVGLGISWIKMCVNPQAKTCISKTNKHARVQPMHRDHTMWRKASKTISTKEAKHVIITLKDKTNHAITHT